MPCYRQQYTFIILRSKINKPLDKNFNIIKPLKKMYLMQKTTEQTIYEISLALQIKYIYKNNVFK